MIVFFERQLEVLSRVVDVGLELLAEVDLFLCGGPFSQRGLGLILVVPEPWLAGERVEFVDVSFQLNEVKGAPLAQKHAFGGRQGML